MNKRYIIVGAGIAGLSAAQAIREADADGTIDIFTAENNLPYSRPMLTKAPFMAFDPADWIIHAQDWFDENNINLHKGVAVLSVNSMEKSVTTEQGNYSYDKLILATGAESFVPPIPGSCKYGVFTIRRPKIYSKSKKPLSLKHAPL